MSGVAEAKCIVATAICAYVCLCVCLSLAPFQHYCMDPDITWGNGRRCPVVVQYWADFESVHNFCWKVTMPGNCNYMLLLKVTFSYFSVGVIYCWLNNDVPKKNKKASICWQHSVPPISVSISVSLHFVRASVLWCAMAANSRYSVYSKITQ